MPAAAMTAGYFGKIPATGDFVAHNLPRTFIDRWDRWMSKELQARPDEGELDRRSWRFTVPPGIFCDQTCAGVWRMSQDRVGRRYPFVVAAVGAAPATDDLWYDSVASVVNSAIAEFRSTGELIKGLSRLEPLQAASGMPAISFWSVDWEIQEVGFVDIHDLADNALPAMRAARVIDV